MSGVLNILQGVGVSPRLTNRSVTAVAVAPDNATAEIEFGTGGNLNTVITEGLSGGVVTNRLPEWHGLNYPLVGIGANYEIRLTVQSGASPGGSAINTWLSLGSAREWFLFRNTTGTSTGQWLVEIRRPSGNVITSATYTMTATMT